MTIGKRGKRHFTHTSAVGCTTMALSLLLDVSKYGENDGNLSEVYKSSNRKMLAQPKNKNKLRKGWPKDSDIGLIPFECEACRNHDTRSKKIGALPGRSRRLAKGCTVIVGGGM